MVPGLRRQVAGRCGGNLPGTGGVGTDKERLLEELWGIATAKVTDFLEIKDGVLTVTDTENLTEGQKAAIAAVEKGTGGIKMKFYDKLKALELLGKYLGLFESGPVSPPSPLLERLLETTRKEVEIHDVPEIQQTAVDCHDLVESPPVGAP